MFSTCSIACVNAVTIAATTQCKVYPRSEVPVRLLIATCDTAFPTGNYDDIALATAFEALISAGKIGATFELADLQWADPTTTQKQYRPRNNPGTTITTGRTLTAKDYNATDVDNAGGASAYFDRDFYKNVVQNKAVRIRGEVTESGRVYLFLDKNGNFMAYDQHYFTGWDNDVEGQSVEFKNYIINFAADPFISVVTPYLDLKLADPTDSLGIAWLYQSN